MDVSVDKAVPTWLLDALELSEAQIASGQSKSLEPVMTRLRESIARMQAALDPEPPPQT